MRSTIFKPHHFELECRIVLDEIGWHKDAYLFQAAAYLWRLGAKGDVAEDLGKASWYLTERRRMIFANDWPLPEGVAIHEAIVFIEQARSRYSDDVVTT